MRRRYTLASAILISFSLAAYCAYHFISTRSLSSPNQFHNSQNGEFTNDMDRKYVSQFYDNNLALLAKSIEANDIEALNLSIRNGADVNAVDKNGISLLLLSYLCKSKSAMLSLLKGGANPNIYIDTTQEIHGLRRGMAFTHLAAQSETDIFEMVFQYGGDVNLPTNVAKDSIETPLLFVIMSNCRDKSYRIHFLAKMNANLTIVGSTTPLICARSWSQQYDICHLLLTLGADPLTVTEYNPTTLMHCLVRDHQQSSTFDQFRYNLYISLISKLESVGDSYSEASKDIAKWDNISHSKADVNFWVNERARIQERYRAAKNLLPK